jgi:putative aldouronate transport system permease protein
VSELKKIKVGDLAFNSFNVIFMLFVVTVTLYPFLNTIAVSFNEGMDSIRGGIYLWPRALTLKNYQSVFVGGTVFNAFFISVARTAISVVVDVFCVTMLAYTLSRPEFVFRRLITVAFVLTMYFSAGLIPGYFLNKSLGLLNNFLVYVIPPLIRAFYLIVARTYIKTIPESMIESAKIDGAGDFRIFLKIIFPLCKPVLATLALFVAVEAWNTWFDTFIFCSSRPELSTLQYELMKLLASTSQTTYNPGLYQGVTDTTAMEMVTPISVRAAITVVAAVPIVIVYPFLQRYFVVGLSIGSVKE